MTNREMAARLTEEELNNLIADIRRGMWGTRHVLALLGQFELLRADLAIASEYHNDEETFEQLWIGYAIEDDAILAPCAIELKRKLRKIVGIDELSADLTAANEALRVAGMELATTKGLLREAVQVELSYRDQRDEARRERDVARECVRRVVDGADWPERPVEMTVEDATWSDLVSLSYALADSAAESEEATNG